MNKRETGWPAALKLRSAKITDLGVRLADGAVESRFGPLVWADVTITYAMAGGTDVAPAVRISVPIPFVPGDSEDQRRQSALRAARQLIDHACVASGLGLQAIQETPEILSGLAQELGLAAPTTRTPGR